MNQKLSSLLLFLVLTVLPVPSMAKSGWIFNPLIDVRWDEVELEFTGLCICPEPPPVFYTVGFQWQYWEPFLAVDTVSEAGYSPFLGFSLGLFLDNENGKNSSSDSANTANESTFAQAHSFPLPLVPSIPLLFCSSVDYTGAWWSEFDPTWQSDELAAILTPEASLFGNLAMQVACMVDAASTNIGFPLDVMPWCIGSGGSTYPVSGHVDNDNIVQANNTVAARLVFKLNRQFQLCDPYALCGCEYTPVWFKSHYKTHTARPDLRSAYPFGQAAKFYDSFLNIPMVGGERGSNDEFLWIVFRKQRCCTCCEL